MLTKHTRFSKCGHSEEAERLAREFEDDMEVELDELVEAQQKTWMDQSALSSTQIRTEKEPKNQPGTSGFASLTKREDYPNDYFDSSDEDEGIR